MNSCQKSAEERADNQDSMVVKIAGNSKFQVYILSLHHKTMPRPRAESLSHGFSSGSSSKASSPRSAALERGTQLGGGGAPAPAREGAKAADTSKSEYAALGYEPLEESESRWPGNPCLQMIKHLA